MRSESDVVHYHHVWSRICALLDKSGILCTVSLPECTGNSARTGLEDHYILHSASVHTVWSGCWWHYLFIILSGKNWNGHGGLSVLTSTSLPEFCFMWSLPFWSMYWQGLYCRLEQDIWTCRYSLYTQLWIRMHSSCYISSFRWKPNGWRGWTEHILSGQLSRHFSRRMREVPMEYTIKQMHWRQLSQSWISWYFSWIQEM